MSQWAVGASGSEEEGGRPARGGQGWRRMGKEGEREREREASPETWGQLIPSHLGLPSQLWFACAADFLLRQCYLNPASPPPCRKKAVSCPLYQPGLAQGNGSGTGRSGLELPFSSPPGISLSLPTWFPHLGWRWPLMKLYLPHVVGTSVWDPFGGNTGVQWKRGTLLS